MIENERPADLPTRKRVDAMNKKDICIASSRQDNEPDFTELYRRSDTGEPYLVKSNRQEESITPERAREFMRACGIPEVDIIQEWGETMNLLYYGDNINKNIKERR